MDALQQLIDSHTEPVGDLHQGIETWRAFPGFQKTHSCAAQPGSVGKLFLANPFLIAQFFDSVREGT